VRICLLTIGSRGDVQPCVALGLALQAQGHHVRVGTHLEFESWIRGLGLDFYPVQGNPRELLQSPQGLEMLETGTHLPRFLRTFRAAAEASMSEGFDDCLAAAREMDLLIVSFFVLPVALPIAHKLKIPLALAWLQPYTPTARFPVLMLPQLFLGGFLNRLSHTLAHQLFWQTFRRIVQDWCQRRDLPVIPFWGPFGQIDSPRYPVLNAFSRHLVAPPHDWPAWVHTTGFWFLDQTSHWQPEPELAHFLQAGPAPVYIGFGSMSSADPRALAELVSRALSLSGQRGLLSQGWGGLEKPEPRENLFLLDQAPHEYLFPQVAAVVHHGGAGTTAAGLRAGKPTVTVPFFADQPFWAWRLYGHGVGTRPLPRPQLSAERLARAIERAVSDTHLRQRAEALGAAIREEGGAVEAARLISQMFAR
jgi:sterol 3beta-glucosyltransferase